MEMEMEMESRDASLSLVKTNLFTPLISNHHRPRTYMTSLVSSKEKSSGVIFVTTNLHTSRSRFKIQEK
jgi:hypothetical protein